MLSEEKMNETFQAMNSELPFIDWELEVYMIKLSSPGDTAEGAALGSLYGGEISTQTHIAIARYEKPDGWAFFTQLIGRLVDKTKEEKPSELELSSRYGKKTLDLVNMHRASRGLKELSWNVSLHSIAFPHSYDMAKGEVLFGYSGQESRFDAIPRRVTGAKTYNESVAYS